MSWLFWGIAAALALLSLGLVFAPLARGAARAERRASYDMAVLRDQLREIDADLKRGALSEAEAAATRIEVSRRLLAAADAEAAERTTGPAPRLSRLAAPAATLALALAALGLYAALGTDLPDQPLAARMAQAAAERAKRPTQAEVEAMLAARSEPRPQADTGDAALVARLQQTLKSRPDDVQGHRLLARGLATLGRWPEARAAQARVLELLGADAAAQDLVDHAELMVLAANGYVSPEAEAALARALAMEPANPVGRYYSGLAMWQGGRPDLAHRVWSALLAQGPPDAPWIAPIEAQIGDLAAAANVEAAAQLPPDERRAMIEGMVAQLAGRLAAEGGPPADWARLIRSLGVLGRRDAAADVLAEARASHAGDAAALAEIDAAARDAGLP